MIIKLDDPVIVSVLIIVILVLYFDAALKKNSQNQ